MITIPPPESPASGRKWLYNIDYLMLEAKYETIVLTELRSKIDIVENYTPEQIDQMTNEIELKIKQRCSYLRGNK